MAQSGYDMYFDKCLFPVTPEKISIKINGNNKTVNLINEGEINILKKTGLTDIEFEAEIPQVKHPYAVYKNGFKEAGYFFDIFEGLKTGKKTFQFIVCRKTPVGKKLLNTNMKVSLEDYKISEDAKNGFDFKVKFNLKQYRDYGTKTVGVAVSDPLMLTAQGVEIIRRKEENKLRQTLARIEELVGEYDISLIVLGLPKHMNNSEGIRVESTMEFKEKLERRLGLEVVMWDERLTTVAADRTMMEAGVRRENRKEYVDMLAAQFILQGYLDSLAFKKKQEQEN